MAEYQAQIGLKPTDVEKNMLENIKRIALTRKRLIDSIRQENPLHEILILLYNQAKMNKVAKKRKYRILQYGLDRWKLHCEHSRILEEEKNKREKNHATSIQKIIRAKNARNRTNTLRFDNAEADLLKKNNATQKIQNIARKRRATIKVAYLRHDKWVKDHEDSAITIQRLYRGYMARGRRINQERLHLVHFLRDWGHGSMNKLPNRRNLQDAYSNSITVMCLELAQKDAYPVKSLPKLETLRAYYDACEDVKERVDIESAIQRKEYALLVEERRLLHEEEKHSWNRERYDRQIQMELDMARKQAEEQAAREKEYEELRKAMEMQLDKDDEERREHFKQVDERECMSREETKSIAVELAWRKVHTLIDGYNQEMMVTEDSLSMKEEVIYREKIRIENVARKHQERLANIIEKDISVYGGVIKRKNTTLKEREMLRLQLSQQESKIPEEESSLLEFTELEKENEEQVLLDSQIDTETDLLKTLLKPHKMMMKMMDKVTNQPVNLLVQSHLDMTAKSQERMKWAQNLRGIRKIRSYKYRMLLEKFYGFQKKHDELVLIRAKLKKIKGITRKQRQAILEEATEKESLIEMIHQDLLVIGNEVIKAVSAEEDIFSRVFRESYLLSDYQVPISDEFRPASLSTSVPMRPSSKDSSRPGSKSSSRPVSREQSRPMSKSRSRSRPVSRDQSRPLSRDNTSRESRDRYTPPLPATNEAISVKWMLKSPPKINLVKFEESRHAKTSKSISKNSKTSEKSKTFGVPGLSIFIEESWKMLPFMNWATEVVNVVKQTIERFSLEEDRWKHLHRIEAISFFQRMCWLSRNESFSSYTKVGVVDPMNTDASFAIDCSNAIDIYELFNCRSDIVISIFEPLTAYTKKIHLTSDDLDIKFGRHPGSHITRVKYNLMDRHGGHSQSIPDSSNQESNINDNKSILLENFDQIDVASRTIQNELKEYQSLTKKVLENCYILSTESEEEPYDLAVNWKAFEPCLFLKLNLDYWTYDVPLWMQPVYHWGTAAPVVSTAIGARQEEMKLRKGSRYTKMIRTEEVSDGIARKLLQNLKVRADRRDIRCDKYIKSLKKEFDSILIEISELEEIRRRMKLNCFIRYCNKYSLGPAALASRLYECYNRKIELETLFEAHERGYAKYETVTQPYVKNTSQAMRGETVDESFVQRTNKAITIDEWTTGSKRPQLRSLIDLASGKRNFSKNVLETTICGGFRSCPVIIRVDAADKDTSRGALVVDIFEKDPKLILQARCGFQDRPRCVIHKDKFADIAYDQEIYINDGSIFLSEAALVHCKALRGLPSLWVIQSSAIQESVSLDERMKDLNQLIFKRQRYTNLAAIKSIQGLWRMRDAWAIVYNKKTRVRKKRFIIR